MLGVKILGIAICVVMVVLFVIVAVGIFTESKDQADEWDKIYQKHLNDRDE